MELITYSTVQTWERFYRANFINSLTGFKSVNLIGSVNQRTQTNLGIFSSIVHIGSDPALVGYINRPIQGAPHTLANIESMQVYTINHIDPSFLKEAHQTSAKYPEEVSEFEEVGLTPEFLPYSGYNQLNATTTIEYELEHPRWQVYPVIDYSITCDIEKLYGKEFVPYLANQRPDSVFLAKESDVIVKMPTRKDHNCSFSGIN